VNGKERRTNALPKVHQGRPRRRAEFVRVTPDIVPGGDETMKLYSAVVFVALRGNPPPPTPHGAVNGWETHREIRGTRFALGRFSRGRPE